MTSRFGPTSDDDDPSVREVSERSEVDRSVEELEALRRGSFDDAVRAEMAYQSRRWGSHHDDLHSGPEWAAIVLERAGDVGRVAFDSGLVGNPTPLDDLQQAAVKLAAVCGSIVDTINRIRDRRARLESD